MAISFGDSISATTDSASSITVSKPTGLSENDLMVLALFTKQGSNPANSTGWTELSHTNSGTDLNLTSLAKIATSSDVAASDFTFNIDGDETIAVLSYVVASEGSFNINDLIVADADTVGGVSGTATFSGGVTPTSVNSFLFMAVGNNGVYAHTNYRISTDNPTWTEEYDQAYTDSQNITMAVAYANRPEQTATGDYLVDFTSADGTTHSGTLIAINESLDTTVSPTVVNLTSSVQAPTVTGGATATPSVISLNFSITTPTITTTTVDWTYESRPAESVWTIESQ